MYNVNAKQILCPQRGIYGKFDMNQHLMVGVTLYQIASPGPTQDPRKLSEPEFIAFYLSLEVGIWVENFLNSAHIWAFLSFCIFSQADFKNILPTKDI